MARPVQATIDAAALRHNLAVARSHAGAARVLAVVKANAYGHGLLRAAQALRDADGFATLELEGAVQLRDAGFRQRIVLLEGFFHERELGTFAEHDFVPVIHAPEQVDMLATLPEDARLDVLIKLNTGMNRLGLQPEAYEAVLQRLRGLSQVRSLTVMTHFASADDARGVDWQMAVLDRMAPPESLPRCLANSAALLRYPHTVGDWVRPGIMLYGCSPFEDAAGPAAGLAPVMELTSEIIAVRDIQPGDTVGYGGLYTADRPRRIAVVACGYADGYPRHAPVGTPVLVGGVRAGTVGRVSMDMLCVDVSDIPAAGVGTPVLLWGRALPVEEVARAAGTISYELLCALAARVPVKEI